MGLIDHDAILQSRQMKRPVNWFGLSHWLWNPNGRKTPTPTTVLSPTCCE